MSVSKPERFILRSKAFEKVMAKEPHFLIKWGLLIIFVLIVLTLLAMAFVPYNEEQSWFDYLWRLYI